MLSNGLNGGYWGDIGACRGMENEKKRLHGVGLGVLLGTWYCIWGSMISQKGIRLCHVLGAKYFQPP